jgi:DinB superfamily
MTETKAKADAISILLLLLDQGYNRKAWHGPTLKGSLRGLSASQASWRPGPGRRCIAEIAVHCAYWKYTSRRRLRGDKRGSFTLKGSNWFPIPDPLDDKTWKGYLDLLETSHRQLRRAIEELSPRQLLAVPPGSRVTNLFLIEGIAAHDIYHAGQIQLLKRLQAKAGQD